MMGGEKLSAIRYLLSVIRYPLIVRARVMAVGVRQNLARSLFLPYSLFLIPLPPTNPP